MPKTYNNLWTTITSFENIYSAYRAARKKHRYQNETLKFTENLEENIIDIQNSLIWHTWEPGKSKEFIVYEPKKRIIQAPTFRDRVVHHAVVNVTEPLFQRKFISHNYACIKNKGSLATALQVQKYLKSHQKSKSIYVIKGDVQSYFPSISHTFLKQQIRRTIRDKNVLWFFDKIIDFYEGDFGMGIGALTSQLFAGINLTPFDHHIKDDLGIKQYVRYMDDFIIVNTDKTALKELLKYCEGYLRDVLLLTINSKSSVIPITHGVDFCGYRIFRDYMLPRKRNMKRAKKRLKKLSYLYENEDGNLEDYRNSLMSFLGYTKHCRAYYSTKSILEETAIGNCPQRRN